MTYILDPLRRLVYARAQGRCEYCHIDERYTGKADEVDHIYAEKHGGETSEANLCLSCFVCNRYKSSDLCSLDPFTGDIARLFHPRRDTWEDHLVLVDGRLEGKTPQGRVVVKVLQLNELERLTERRALIHSGRYGDGR
jgi:HNH endonuclease